MSHSAEIRVKKCKVSPESIILHKFYLGLSKEIIWPIIFNSPKAIHSKTLIIYIALNYKYLGSTSKG